MLIAFLSEAPCTLVSWAPDSATSWATRRGLQEFVGRGAPVAAAPPPAASMPSAVLHLGTPTLSRTGLAVPIPSATWPGVGVSDEFGRFGAAAPGVSRWPLPVDLSKARSPFLFYGACLATANSAIRSFEEGATPYLLAYPTSALTRRTSSAMVSVFKRLRWVRARQLEDCAVPLLLMGAAASGRRTCGTGAHPRSYTSAPRLPERAADGATGSGALRPCPWVRRPSPRGLVVWLRTSAAAMVYLETSSGHCRCNRTAEALSLGAVGRVGFGRLGFRVPRAAFAQSASRSCGTRAGTLAPLSPFPGSCGLYQSSEASDLEAVV